MEFTQELSSSSVLFCSLFLSLFPLYTQPPLQNVRMWQLSALCPRQNRTRNCPGNCPVLRRARRVDLPLLWLSIPLDCFFRRFSCRWDVLSAARIKGIRFARCSAFCCCCCCCWTAHLPANAKEFVCESAAGFFGNSIDCKAFVYCNK